MSMRKRLFSVKSVLVYLARIHCFPHVCAPKKHSGKQCFRSNVSSFSGALNSDASQGIARYFKRF